MRPMRATECIERFLDTPFAIAEVTDWTQSRPENCAFALKKAAKRMGYRVGTFVKDKKVYLYKEDEYGR